MTTTGLFGENKFGTFKFGPASQDRPLFGLEVDWDNDGMYDGQNEAIHLQDLSIVRGRKYLISADGESFQEEETGRLSATLLDENRRYDPYNDTSPLTGGLSGGKYFRVQVRTPADDIYPLMAGILDDPSSFSESTVNKSRFEGTDGWAFLRNQRNEVTVPLQQNIYAEQAIAMVLDRAGWPRIWGSDLGAGVDQRPYFWVDARSAAKVIHDLAHSELGNVSISADGKLRYRSRLSFETEVAFLTEDDIRIDTLRRLSPAEVIRNVIKIESSPRSEEAVQTVWEIPSRLQVLAGETISDLFVEFKYNSATVPVKDPIAPVSGTDFNATANDDGTGTDLTANVSIAMYPFGTKANLVITNNGASTAWVYVKVRGVPLSSPNTISFVYEDELSIRQFGRRPFTLSIDQNVNVARQYLDILKAYMNLSRNFLTVELLPNPELQFKLDLGQIVRGQFSSLSINQPYRIIRIAHKWNDKAGLNTRTTLWLEPYMSLFVGIQIPFQLPVQLGSA